jgi:hypothetical protein
MNQQISHYLFLISGLALGLFGFFGFIGHPVLRITVAAALGIYYFGWGIIHHSIDGSLHRIIVLEYLLMAILAVTVLVSLVIRA